LLHGAIAAAPEQHAVRSEQRGADRDTTLGQSGPRLFERDVHHRRRRARHSVIAAAVHAIIFHRATGGRRNAQRESSI
jgi:hypothetical protein